MSMSAYALKSSSPQSSMYWSVTVKCRSDRARADAESCSVRMKRVDAVSSSCQNPVSCNFATLHDPLSYASRSVSSVCPAMSASVNSFRFGHAAKIWTRSSGSVAPWSVNDISFGPTKRTSGNSATLSAGPKNVIDEIEPL